MIELILFVLGLTWVGEFLLTIANYLKCFLFSSKFSYERGTWALITGSTDGIGKGFAIALAKKGINIIQVSRNPSKLSSLASDLCSKYGIQVKSIAKDFSECTKNPIEFYLDIFKETQGLDVRIVVNNVGTGVTKPFLRYNVNEIHMVLALNAFPIAFIGKLFAAGLVEKKGVMINLSSVMAEILMKNRMLYAGTKAFDIVISDTLASEGVPVLGLQPGFVRTQLVAKIKYRPFMIEIEECAEGALKSIGVVSRSSGHWKHNFFILVLKALNPFLGLLKLFNLA